MHWLPLFSINWTSTPANIRPVQVA